MLLLPQAQSQSLSLSQSILDQPQTQAQHVNIATDPDIACYSQKVEAHPHVQAHYT